MLLKKIPNIELPDLHGEKIRISDYAGKKLFIFMWASWCGCRHQLPGWQAFYDKYKKHEFNILSVSADIRGAGVVKPYAEQFSFSTIVDRRNVFGDTFGFKLVPNGIFVDENRVIRMIKQNISVENIEHIRFIEKLLFGEIEKAEFPEEQYNSLSKFEKELVQVKMKSAIEYIKQDNKEQALIQLDEAQLHAPDDFVIRKQRWILRYPEKFEPTIDYHWQNKQLEKEKREEEILRDAACGPTGCMIKRDQT